MDAGLRYKILIADDEHWTREKLRTMIRWEEYGLQFMEPAVDGEDVLRKIEIDKPDILITDINMPFINGVELLNKLNQEHPEIITFVISGYNDFDYVKEAFMAGTINYLTKPVAKIDLIQALSKALEIISSRAAEQEEILEAASLIEDREFSLLVEREETLFTPPNNICSNNDFAGSSLILIKFHQMKEVLRAYEYKRNRLSIAIKTEIKRLLDDEDVIVFNHTYRSNEFLAITDMNADKMVQIARKLVVVLYNLTKSVITICISQRSYSLDSIHVAYVETVALLMDRGFTKHNEVVIAGAERIQKNGEGISSRVSQEQENQLKSHLRSGNKLAIRRLIFDSIGIKYCQEKKWGYLEVKQTVKKIANILSEYAATYIQPKELVDMESMVFQADKIVEMLDNTALCEALEAIIELTVIENRETATETMKDIVKQAADYIDEYYYEDISLTGLANQYNVEPSYFSKLFRQQIGETLMVYLTKVRIEKAKTYMKDPTINLTEISFMVGYDDYSYFSRVFRKIIGMSPRDYRNRI